MMIMRLLPLLLFASAVHGVFALQSLPLVKFWKKIAAGSTAAAVFIGCGSLQCSAVVVGPAAVGIVKDRLLPCPVEGSCVSTVSVRSLDKYARPWVYEGSDAAAWESLKRELASNALFKVVEVRDDLKYLRAEARSALPPTGTDDVEFLLLPADNLVSYRSNSRESSFVGDGGSHRNRLSTIRNHLQFKEMGSEDAEYDAFFREQERSSGFADALRSGFGFMQAKPSEINFLDNSVPVQETPVPFSAKPMP